MTEQSKVIPDSMTATVNNTEQFTADPDIEVSKGVNHWILSAGSSASNTIGLSFFVPVSLPINTDQLYDLNRDNSPESAYAYCYDRSNAVPSDSGKLTIRYNPTTETMEGSFYFYGKINENIIKDVKGGTFKIIGINTKKAKVQQPIP